MFGKIGKVLKIVEGLGHDIGDIKAAIAAIMALLSDVKAVLGEVKGITSSTPVAAGTVVVAAPPTGHVLVPILAEHVAVLPAALASIVAQQSASMAGVGPPK
jgi:hypothetical protein